LFGQAVRILEDPLADPEKGTGAVMCCTFGDTTDKEWWYTHHLPLVEAIARDGRMTAAAGEFAGLTLAEARRQIVAALEDQGLVLDRQPTYQTVRVHERCDTPVEYIMSQQWFIRVLDHKPALLEAGEQIHWFPEQMGARYRSWVENLAWDWCISRQRYFGVPFPLWHCQACGEVILAEEGQLPVDPTGTPPPGPCRCGNVELLPEEDVLDTWATSSMSPQIAGRWLDGEERQQDSLYERVFPFSLRPQGHEIIRTWAFYTIVKSYLHFDARPWKDVAISGWGIAGEGMGKISKSRGGGPTAPLEMIQRYSADAVRYWAASTGLGKDSVISEEKIQTGSKLVTKLWNVARFSERFLACYQPAKSTEQAIQPASLHSASPTRPRLQIPFTPADRWILARTQRLIRRATHLLDNYEFAAAKSEIENFFWSEFADNYLEMCKQRLYAENHPQREAACDSLYQVLLATLKLFAPFLPHVTEEIYRGVYAGKEFQPAGKASSIHLSRWPTPDESLEDELAEATGEALVEIATAVRRYKSEHSLPLSAELDRLELAAREPQVATQLQEAASDLLSITRARSVEVVERVDPVLTLLPAGATIQVAISPPQLTKGS
jgi:valyl-tRNA synthetase